MKAELGKRKTVRGRIVSHVARIGPVSTEGNTPAEATQACESAVLDALARLSQGMDVKRWRGHIVIVSPDCGGWAYWLDTFRDDHIQPHSGSRVQVMNAALHHLAQCVWEPEFDDRAFVEGLPSDVAREIAAWIRFQRRYAELKAEGKNDTEAHELACRASSAVSGALTVWEANTTRYRAEIITPKKESGS